MKVHASFSGDIGAFDKFDKLTAQKLKGAMIASLQLINDKAKEKLQWRVLTFDSKGNVIGASGGGRAMGHLANSLAHEITAEERDTIIGRVGTNQKYAKYVEFGTRRHFVPFDKYPDVQIWAERHGIDVTKRQGLMVTGKPTPYLTPSIAENIEAIKSKFRAVKL